jgi:hypothetical protein
MTGKDDRMKRISVMFSLLTLATALSLPGVAQVKDDLKDAGKDTKHAAKDVGDATATGAKKTGKAVKKGAKKTTHAAASGTEKGAEKVKEKTQ